ncbi:unnamed protein product [Toxocara canis]|uniref:26S proteasome non-ATPase regulatory subunit 5 n=1 Tax=Toxocara canis TaxID=6265 RepID=A0A183UA72_TOXCA|nr:unnamed protein product [Toxocara canis]
MDFLANALDLLEKNAVDELKEAIIGADHDTLNIAFMELFAAMMNKYDDMASEQQCTQPLLAAIMHLNKNAHVKPKEMYIALMDVYEAVRAPSAVQLVLEMLLELLGEMNNNCMDEIRDHVLPSLLQERIMKQLVDEDIARVDVVHICGLFIRLFRSSGCKKADLLESLISEVVSCLPQTSAGFGALIDSSFTSYVDLGQNPASSTLLIASSQHSARPCIPVVYSADYRFERCLPALIRSLSVRFSNSHNISLVLEVLQGFIPAISELSLSRHRMPLFMEFFCALLRTCGNVGLGDIHDECLKAFVSSLQRFEPIAQLLILRRLIRLIKIDHLKVSLESQVMGWLIDLYRYRMQKYPIFKAELGFLWAELTELRYTELHESVHFYTALLVLAQFQALHRINKELLREVDLRVLGPLQQQLADWTTLTTTDSGNDERVQSLPFLQFTMLQTRNYVNQFLSKER